MRRPHEAQLCCDNKHQQEAGSCGWFPLLFSSARDAPGGNHTHERSGRAGNVCVRCVAVLLRDARADHCRPTVADQNVAEDAGGGWQLYRYAHHFVCRCEGDESCANDSSSHACA